MAATANRIPTVRTEPARARVAVRVVFAARGAGFATWAARVPAARQRLGLDNGTLALVTFAPSAPAGVAGFTAAGLGVSAIVPLAWSAASRKRPVGAAGVSIALVFLLAPAMRAGSVGRRS